MGVPTRDRAAASVEALAGQQPCDPVARRAGTVAHQVPAGAADRAPRNRRRDTGAAESRMIGAPAAERPASVDARALLVAGAFPFLLVVGYYALSDPRIAAAAVGAVVVAAWGVFALRRPHAAI